MNVTNAAKILDLFSQSRQIAISSSEKAVWDVIITTLRETMQQLAT